MRLGIDVSRYARGVAGGDAGTLPTPQKDDPAAGPEGRVTDDLDEPEADQSGEPVLGRADADAELACERGCRRPALIVTSGEPLEDPHREPIQAVESERDGEGLTSWNTHGVIPLDCVCVRDPWMEAAVRGVPCLSRGWVPGALA